MTGVIVPFSAAYAAAPNPGGRGFTSFKCPTPIEYVRRCARDALIQATLEPEISSVEPLKSPRAVPDDTYFAFAVISHSRRCAIILTDVTTNESITAPEDCDVAVAINRASILAEPVKTTARTVWAHRDTIVPALFSVRLMRRLQDKPNGTRIIELEDALIDEPRRWVDFILALACRGLVTLDYRRPLTDHTLVSLGPPGVRV